MRSPQARIARFKEKLKLDTVVIRELRQERAKAMKILSDLYDESTSRGFFPSWKLEKAYTCFLQENPE